MTLNTATVGEFCGFRWLLGT